MARNIHLICNAHLDPVWLWQWEEGAAEVLSTFRVAADFCDEFDSFVFNHNEAVLYEWIEEYEPPLFKRIQELVAKGKWHIMGGWYLQPDCNMPSGESFIRQIMVGQNYFKSRFGKQPTTAINFDSFGHSRGLVQIMKKTGYDSYLFTRPGHPLCVLENNDFIWVGFDGSEIMGHRALSYGSKYGEAAIKIRESVQADKDKKTSLILWGIGNHGGGPSRIDLKDIEALKKEIGPRLDVSLIHSIPEDYFKELSEIDPPEYRHSDDLNLWAVGCYTTQVRIKQKHRQLENILYSTEKMMNAAYLQGKMEYDSMDFDKALKALLFCEFHDILPGSSTQLAENAAIGQLEYGIHLMEKLRARAFFALSDGQDKAAEDEIPVMIYNPHPYKVSDTFECEFSMPIMNWEDKFGFTRIYQDGNPIPSQTEREVSDLNLDWRKRAVFSAELEPFSMNRFDCRIEFVKEKPGSADEIIDDESITVFSNDASSKGKALLKVDRKTGLVSRYSLNGTDFLKYGAMQLKVMTDSEDSWSLDMNRYDNVEGIFRLMTQKESDDFTMNDPGMLPPVRIVEDGEARAIVESLMKYNNSSAVMRYILNKQSGILDIDLRLFWFENHKIAKLCIPQIFTASRYFAQTAFGIQNLKMDADECVMQKWVAVADDKYQIACINNRTYGTDYRDNELRISIVRSPDYASTLLQRPKRLTDRYIPKMDKGENVYNFRLLCGLSEEISVAVESQALQFNEKPFALSFFPSGAGKKDVTPFEISDKAVICSAFKQTEYDSQASSHASEHFKKAIVRLYESTGQPKKVIFRSVIFNIEKDITFTPFEVKTFAISISKSKSEMHEVMMNENEIER
ncbi:MAG: glycoside hydrolase family 38 N-terminal domain-containing protein [Saccharofermentanales bacterium]